MADNLPNTSWFADKTSAKQAIGFINRGLYRLMRKTSIDISSEAEKSFERYESTTAEYWVAFLQMLILVQKYERRYTQSENPLISRLLAQPPQIT